MNYAYASQATCAAQGFLNVINDAILYPLIMLLTAVALLMFLWGGFRFITNADNTSEREKGRKHMIFGIIGLLVMVSALAILTIAANTFGLGFPDTSCGGTAPAVSSDAESGAGGSGFIDSSAGSGAR